MWEKRGVGKSRWRRYQSRWQDVDAVSVVIEGGLVQQIGPDCIRGMENAGIRGIAEGVSNRRHVVAAPHAGNEVLRHLLGDESTINGQLAGRVVIDSRDFFPEVVRNTHGGLELISIGRCGENASEGATSSQQRLSVSIEKRERVAVKRDECWILRDELSGIRAAAPAGV